MTIYERIFNIDESTFDKLMSAGVLRANAKRDLLIYDFYLSRTTRFGSMQAITDAAEKFCLSETMIQKIIYRVRHITVINTRNSI